MTEPDDASALPDSVRVRRVRLRHYRNIRACDIELGPLTFLVGPNGAGKSNFLDALRLVQEALTTSLSQALRERGGIGEVRSRPPDGSVGVSLRLDLPLATHRASYAFELGALADGGFEIVREECLIRPTFDVHAEGTWFSRERETVRSSEPVLPLVSAERLYLVTSASLPAFHPVFDTLSRMAFYNPSPEQMRRLQTPDPGAPLARDARNVASVLHRMKTGSRPKETIEEFLRVIVPGLSGVDHAALGPMEALEFRQQVEGESALWRFPAQSMSDGTLRALAVLVAIFQTDPKGLPPSLVGLEEPESAVYPFAAAVLRDALAEASLTRQIVVTSHSHDLLDDPDVSPDTLVAVESQNGVSLLARPNQVSLSALRDRLYTAGELLRINHLSPDSQAPGLDPERLAIFEHTSS